MSGGVSEQTAQCLRNLEAVCAEAGCSLEDAVKVTVYMTDLSQFPVINQAYGEHFAGAVPPARATVGVAELPLGSEVEIDAIVACR